MSRTIRATYRVQLHAGFGFPAVARMSPYLHQLGVSHLYCSPVLAAATGSTHGYDVVDPTRLDQARGGEQGFGALVEALAASSVGIVVDIVPNHMALTAAENTAWRDVLRNGPDSPYARWFDVVWAEHRGRPRVVVPILGDHLGRMIDAGTVAVVEDGAELLVRVPGAELPLRPGSVTEVLGHVSATDAVRRLSTDREALDVLLDCQHYRLAHWRMAAERLAHRRFFDVTTLIGVRVEDPDVFAATHSAIAGLVRTGAVDELRVDHVDGLRRPRQYLLRLCELVGGQAPAGRSRIVVEKILQSGELLRESWPVAGTSGYDFLTRVNHLFVEERNEAELTAALARYTGSDVTFHDVAYDARRYVTDHVLAPEVDRLTGLLAQACSRHRRHRDHTRRDLRDALCTVLACMPVYRTYVHPDEPASDADRHVVAVAIAEAAARNRSLDSEMLALIGSVLLCEVDGAEELTERFQQVSSAVMAKGVEDTAFYRYHRLVSLNDVGGDPGRFGEPVPDFHRHNALVAARWPETMLTLSTHDTKRSADVRARINVLSEIPTAWTAALECWSARLDEAGHAGRPDRAMRYLLFQTLVGAWPISADRLQAFARKAAREAKVHTSWTTPDDDYERALDAAVVAMLEVPTLVSIVERLLAEHRVVERGAVSSLAQVALLLTAPGVPDLYNGDEVLDLSLVDPDNRRPLDVALLAERLAAARSWDVREAAAHLVDGGAKQWLISRLLHHIAGRVGGDISEPAYRPLPIDGTAARHAVAFQRDSTVTIVPRLTDRWPWEGWGGTIVELPGGQWMDVLGGSTRPAGPVSVGDLLTDFPVSVLSRKGD